jgi:hypothetical protein
MVNRKCKIAMAWILSYTKIGIATSSAMAYAQYKINKSAA